MTTPSMVLPPRGTIASDVVLLLLLLSPGAASSRRNGTMLLLLLLGGRMRGLGVRQGSGADSTQTRWVTVQLTV